jgi:hypothetical protein
MVLLSASRLRLYFAILFSSIVLCSEGASEISQPHCGWTRARKPSRPERTPETPRPFSTVPSGTIYFIRRHQPLRSWLISIRRFATWLLRAFALKNPCFIRG